MSPKKKEPDLETALAELEGIVEAMEAGEMTLDETMQRFERGIELTRVCQTALKDAEQKVDILMKKAADDGGLEAFEPESD